MAKMGRPRKVRCYNCNGTGLKRLVHSDNEVEFITCPTCRGIGKVKENA